MQTGILKGSGLVEQTIPAFAARRQFGKLLRDVETKGAKIVVERNGQPVAVVVPIELYQQWKQARQRFFDMLRKVSAQSSLSEDEAMRIANEAVKSVRSQQT